jgi:hypothetical protein
VGAKADTVTDLTDRDSWLAAHRIEFRPPGPVRLGVYEAVAWSGRGFDLGYANPATLLLAVTQDLTDRSGVDDKKVLGFDFTADLAPVTLYGELLVNRIITLDTADQGANDEATTWAQLAGLRWAGPLGLSGADLDLEYAHLDPEVYFHQDRDPRKAFLSEGELIGHWLGPNADSFHARFAVPLGERAGDAAVSFESSRWGVIDGRRGADLGFFGLRKRDKHWITGAVESERVVALEWRRDGLEMPASLVLDAGLTVARVDREGAAAPGRSRAEDARPAMDARQATDGRPAKDGWQAEVRLTLRGGIVTGR